MKNNKNHTYLFLSCLCLVSMFLFPEVMKSTAAKALNICLVSVIPSLFPFIVISKTVLLYYVKTIDGRHRNGKTIFGLSGIGIISFILGLISGFPAGAVLAGTMYKSGIISKNEAEKIAVFSSGASPSFCIVYFGSNILNSRICGLAVYISVVSVAVITLIFDFYFNREKTSKSEQAAQERNITTESFTNVIVKSFSAVLNICAFVMFFMCIGEIIIRISGFIFPILYSYKPIICGFFEFSGGLALLSEISYGERFMLGSAIIGLGGISAIMQVSDICENYGLSYKKIIPIKAVSTTLVPLFSFLIMSFIGFWQSKTDLLIKVNIRLPMICVILIVFCIFIGFITEKCRKNIRKAKLISKI